MKWFTGHLEQWGGFVDVKVNTVELLRHVIGKSKPGRVWISGVCDAYQPVERKYRLTRGCLEILLENGWPVTRITIDRLNYRHADWVYKKYRLKSAMTVEFFAAKSEELKRAFDSLGVECRVI